MTTLLASRALAFRFCVVFRPNKVINSGDLVHSHDVMGYRFLDHMTDAIIEAYGTTLEEAFQNAALGLIDTMIDLKTVRPEKKIKLTAKGHDLCSLLFDWLDKVLLLLVADWIALSQFSIKIIKHNNGYSIEGTALGEPLDVDRHRYKVEIKAVTYHEMEIKQEEGLVTVKFLVDL